MAIPILNILIGAALIFGGASGRLALLGTDSTSAIVVVGAIVIAIGIFQLVRSMQNR
jgi:hypothetical protein